MSDEKDNPYVGLRPYKESDKGLFFGRDADRKVLVDMVLANRFTLLFAASGVGKSSLLQAAVLPHMKDPARENLDAVYCNNWAGDPLVSLREAALRALEGRLESAALRVELADLPLPEFFRVCAQFGRQPLIVVLDQFEEFFYYHQSAPAFPSYRQQLVQLITDQRIPLSIVVSMREDFALLLNVFKPELPTVLFNNFYRLEKLGLAEAEAAIVRPAALRGYSYEPELLKALLADLATRERRVGAPVAETALAIEPPYLQIICSQLFELDRGDQELQLRLATYETHGKAKGLLASYIYRVMAALSYPERRLASWCFSHLVTRRGTKVAHTAASLARELRVDEGQLGAVLRKLEQARLLRSQSQGEKTWFELYHDLFSNSIEQWNERFKARERLLKLGKGVAAAFAAAAALYVAFDAGVNHANQHVRLSNKALPDDQVELWQGQARTWTLDLFKQRRFLGETGIVRKQMEPDLLFSEEQVRRKRDLPNELATRMSASQRMLLYREEGNFDAALRLVEGALNSGDQERQESALASLASFRSRRAFKQVSKAYRRDQRREEKDPTISRMPLSRTMAEFLEEHWDDLKDPLEDASEEVLAMFPTPFLIRSLSTVEHYSPRGKLFRLLETRLGAEFTSTMLSKFTIMDSKETREEIIMKIVGLHDRKNIDKLERLLPNVTSDAKIDILFALGELNENAKFIEPFLDDSDDLVKTAAAIALGKVGTTIPIQSLKERCSAAGSMKLALALSWLIARRGDQVPLGEMLSRQDVRRAMISDRSRFARSPFSEAGPCSLDEIDSFVRRERSKVRFPNLFEPLATNPRALQMALKGADPRFKATILRCLPDPLTPEITAIVNLCSADTYEPLRTAVEQHFAHQLISKPTIELTAGAFNDKYSVDVRREALHELISRSFDVEIPKSSLVSVVSMARDLANKKDADVQFRFAAMNVLAAWSASDAIAELSAYLKDPDIRIREEATQLLISLQDPEAAAAVIGAASRGMKLGKSDVLIDFGDDIIVKQIFRRLDSKEFSSEDLERLEKMGIVPTDLEAQGKLLASESREQRSLVPLLSSSSLGKIQHPATRFDVFFPLLRSFDLDFVDLERRMNLLSRRGLGSSSFSYRDDLFALLIYIGSSFLDKLQEIEIKEENLDSSPNTKFWIRLYGAPPREMFSTELGSTIITIPTRRSDNSDSRTAEQLLQTLNEKRSEDDFLAAASALAARKEPRAATPIIQMLLRLRGGYKWQEIARDLLSDLETLGIRPGNIRALRQDRELAPFWAANCQEPFLSNLSKPTYLTIDQRKAVAELLTKWTRPCTEKVLSPLTHDPSAHVRAAAALAFAVIKTPTAIHTLEGLLVDSSTNVQQAAAKALAESADPSSVPALRKVLRDPETPIVVNLEVLTALGKIGTAEAVDALLEAGEQQEETQGLRAYRLLGDLKAHKARALPRLRALLALHEKAFDDWRHHRDRPSSGRPLADAAKPQEGPRRRSTYITYELALAITRLSDPPEAIQLLKHPMVDVREAAALGLGLRGRVELIQELDRQRAASDNPLFRHAAYRAIDWSLLTIEKHGTADHLAALRKAKSSLPSHDGVIDRVDWTLYELEGRLDDQKGTADSPN